MIRLIYIRFQLVFMNAGRPICYAHCLKIYQSGDPYLAINLFVCVCVCVDVSF